MLKNLISFLVLSLASRRLCIQAAPEPRPTKLASRAFGFNGLEIPGFGRILAIQPDFKESTTSIAGKIYPVLAGTGRLILYNSSESTRYILNNEVEGSFKLTYKEVDGKVLPDLQVSGGQDETEIVTAAGFTFSDGTGTVSTAQGLPQVFGTLDILSGASGRLGVGDISVALGDRTFDLGDVNGAQINSNGAYLSVAGSAAEVSHFTAIGHVSGSLAPTLTSAGGEIGGGIFGSKTVIAGGTAAASYLGSEGFAEASGILESILEFSGSVQGGKKGIGGAAGGSLFPIATSTAST